MTRTLSIFFALLCVPFVAAAQTVLNAYQVVEVNAPARTVWDAAKNWNALHFWHPVFASTELIGGENNVPGAKRRLTIKDGPVFDEELLAWDDTAMKLRYVIIGEHQLPLTDYASTMQVIPLSSSRCFVVWRGSFVAKPGAKEEDVMKLIVGAYRAGLDNLQQMTQVK